VVEERKLPECLHCDPKVTPVAVVVLVVRAVAPGIPSVTALPDTASNRCLRQNRYHPITIETFPPLVTPLLLQSLDETETAANA
jgi:hypothetical protein